MTDIFAVMRGHVVAALTDMLPDQPPEAFARVVVEPPKDAAHGDMSTNAAMLLGAENTNRSAGSRKVRQREQQLPRCSLLDGLPRRCCAAAAAAD